MKKYAKLLVLPVVLAAVIFGAAAAYRRLAPVTEPAITVSEALTAGTQRDAAQTAPDFTVQDADGNPVTFSGQLGRPIILNFWATWCPPCRSELGYFNDAAARCGDQITFMMIDLTDGVQETQEDVAAFLAEQGYDFPVYYDTAQEAAYAYGVNSIPLTVCIAADGTVTESRIGAMHESELQTLIDRLLA